MAELDPGVMAPVPELIVSPAGLEEKLPPAVPVRVTFCTPATEQNGEPEYEMVALGMAVTVRFAPLSVPVTDGLLLTTLIL